MRSSCSFSQFFFRSSKSGCCCGLFISMETKLFGIQQGNKYSKAHNLKMTFLMNKFHVYERYMGYNSLSICPGIFVFPTKSLFFCMYVVAFAFSCFYCRSLTTPTHTPHTQIFCAAHILHIKAAFMNGKGGLCKLHIKINRNCHDFSLLAIQ